MIQLHQWPSSDKKGRRSRTTGFHLYENTIGRLHRIKQCRSGGFMFCNTKQMADALMPWLRHSRCLREITVN